MKVKPLSYSVSTDRVAPWLILHKRTELGRDPHLHHVVQAAIPWPRSREKNPRAPEKSAKKSALTYTALVVSWISWYLASRWLYQASVSWEPEYLCCCSHINNSPETGSNNCCNSPASFWPCSSRDNQSCTPGMLPPCLLPAVPIFLWRTRHVHRTIIFILRSIH